MLETYKETKQAFIFDNDKELSHFYESYNGS